MIVNFMPVANMIMIFSFISYHLKFEKAKFPYFFNLWPRGRDIGPFPLLMACTPLRPEAQKMQWPYFGFWATNKKGKVTFFSSTFKV